MYIVLHMGRVLTLDAILHHTITLHCIQRPIAADGSDACELVRMAVKAEHRGKGIAKMLARTVATYADSLGGCNWVVLSTSKEMSAAVKTYTSQ